jgi:4-hydroxybenzoyl-CoA thioesterase
MTEPAPPTFVNRRTVRIAWGDCDPAQIVFYPRYFAHFDESTHELFRAALGAPKPVWTKRFGIMGIPMVDTRGKFIVPSMYADDVVIESRIAKFGRSSFDVEHKILRGTVLAVEGFETRVWTRVDPSRPSGLSAAPIPDDVKTAFA